jgi:3-hydroxy-3-methylglutaryl CoA synthase
MFSYGSGMASSMFTIKVQSNPSFMREKMKAYERLNERVKVPADIYDKIMEERKSKYGKVPFTPKVITLVQFTKRQG